jgi:N-acetylglutamate synthase-like GNAT family acetyltransferase
MGTPKDVRRGRRATARRATAASPVTLREARLEDAPAVAALLDELGYPSTTQQAARRLETIAHDPATIVLVADVAGEVAGLAALHEQNLVEQDYPGCECAALVVGERFRRQGVGERLMGALEDEARKRGAKHFVLNTAHRRAAAHAFYEALGYEHSGRRYAKEL